MSTKPPQLEGHPTGYGEAISQGMIRGHCCGVRDGDTIEALVDLGLDHCAYEAFRIKGLRCAETRTKDRAEKKLGMAAKNEAMDFAWDMHILIRTSKTKNADKKTFSRYVADVLVWDETEWKDFATHMKEAGHHGKGK